MPTDNQVIEVLNSYYVINIDKIKLENAFTHYLPDYTNNKEEQKIRNTLLSAVFNTQVEIDLPDLTFLVTPVFRAMEYYLHRILHDYLKKKLKLIEKRITSLSSARI